MVMLLTRDGLITFLSLFWVKLLLKMTIRKVYKLVHCCCRSSHLHLANLTVCQVSSASFSSLSPLYVFFPSAYFFCYYLCVTSFGPPEIYNKIFHCSLEALQSILSLYLTQEKRKKKLLLCSGLFSKPCCRFILL